MIEISGNPSSNLTEGKILQTAKADWLIMKNYLLCNGKSVPGKGTRKKIVLCKAKDNNTLKYSLKLWCGISEFSIAIHWVQLVVFKFSIENSSSDSQCFTAFAKQKWPYTNRPRPYAWNSNHHKSLETHTNSLIWPPVQVHNTKRLKRHRKSHWKNSHHFRRGADSP